MRVRKKKENKYRYSIYRFINMMTGEKYVGQTIEFDPQKRYRTHINDSKRMGTKASLIAKKIKEYGIENFIWEVIAEGKNMGDLNYLERYLIKQEDCMEPKGYNVHPGGAQGPLSQAHREKIAASNRGKKLTPEQRKNLSEIHKQFKTEIELEICEKYKSGVFVADLARKYNCIRGVISRIIRVYNLSPMPTGNMRILAGWEKAKIIEDYKNGNYINKISKELKVKFKTVANILRENGFKIEKGFRKLLKFKPSEQQINDIISKYNQEHSLRVIAKEYNTTAHLIKTVLKENGISIRAKAPKRASRGPMKQETRDRISQSNMGRVGVNKGKKLTEEHRANLSKAAMGKPGTNKGKKFDEEWKKNMSVAMRTFSPEKEIEIATKYANGTSSSELAKEYECGINSIPIIVKRSGFEVREKGHNFKNGGKKFTNEEIKSIINFYVNCKYSLTTLGKQYNCRSSRIEDILLNYYINIRRRIKRSK